MECPKSEWLALSSVLMLSQVRNFRVTIMNDEWSKTLRMNYREITTAETLVDVLESSERQPVLFFKHSNTCGVSNRALSEFRRYLQAPESALVGNYLIVIQNAREVSAELARLTGVQHESPQAVIVAEGRAVWNDSHLALKCGTLIEAVRHVI
jgi:monothiol bacilliredoxin